MGNKKGINRRTFIKKAATAGVGLSIVPSYVLGGEGDIPPSEKINVGIIGFGAQSLKMLPDWLRTPELQFNAVCDPNEHSYDYLNWGAPQDEIMGKPGGREVGQQLINDFYAHQKQQGSYNGCSAYADFRVMLEKEEDLDAVFVMTPDHLHANIAVAAMENGLKVSSHKPIGNFMHETRAACETAKNTSTQTHLFAFQGHEGNHQIAEWINQGAIGDVRELHRWTNRPMWPQGSPYLPEDTPPVPDGFDWDLWLGPAKHRKYSPDYTHGVFRGWHEFGSGCLGDMGYYGLLVDWRVLNLGMPDNVLASASVVCDVKEYRSSWVTNEVSFPHAATVQWEVPVNGDTDKTIDVFWSSGGLRPDPPEALKAEGRGLSAEGVMYVGDDGVILAEYGYGNPEIIGVPNADEIVASTDPEQTPIDYAEEMVNSFKNEVESRGSYPRAQTVAETICLGNIAIRTDQEFRSNKILEWDSENLEVTNMEEANKFVRRDVRSGWEL